VERIDTRDNVFSFRDIAYIEASKSRQDSDSQLPPDLLIG